MRSKVYRPQTLQQGSLGILSVVLTLMSAQRVQAFAYIFAGEGNEDRVTHQLGYTGVGGNLTITVGVDPTSVSAALMLTPAQNVVNTWNQLVPTTGNLVTDFSTIPAGQIDFESVLLHEMGHSLGLAHPNLASESGLNGANREYTKSTDGENNTFDLDSGVDGVIGSADDIRGDDVNLNYFRMADNDPFATNLGVVDSTTYSRDLADLPVGDTYAANADRSVGAALGYANTEAVAQQGTSNNEIQRELGADDVAGILYSQSGLDEIAGTADDYTFTLDFLGLNASADILIDFDNNETGFAVSKSVGSPIDGTDHFRITSTSIFLNSGFDWFFNQESNIDMEAVPEPLTVGGTLVALGLGWQMRRIKREDRA